MKFLMPPQKRVRRPPTVAVVLHNKDIWRLHHFFLIVGGSKTKLDMPYDKKFAEYFQKLKWCVGQEKKWQIWLKRLAIIPIVLLPIVIVIILVTKYNLGETADSNVDPNTLTNQTYPQMEREKRHTPDKRFKRCYKLYRKLHPNRESFLDTENNSETKLDFLEANPSYFYSRNPDKHREIKKCLAKFRDKDKIFRKRYRRSGKVRSFWTEKFSESEVREEQGKIMKKYMNENVDPCDNFYEFACGNWNKYYDVPPDKAVYDTFEMVRENLYLVLRELLESDVDQNEPTNVESNYHDPKVFIDENYMIFEPTDAIIKAKKFYRSCMNEEIINKRAEKPLLKLLEELGGWPMITSNWKKSDFDLLWVLSRLRLLNNDILIAQWIGPDIKNSNKHIIHIDQTTLGLPSRDYFLDPSNRKFLMAYKALIYSLANLLGASPIVALKDVNDLIDFETKLATILSPIEDRRNITEIYQRITIETLMDRYPNFAWSSYFTIILGKEIDLKSTVACYCARYIHQLLNLLSKTNPRTIQNYLLWRFIKHRTTNLDSRFSDLMQRFYQALLGREKQPPRWQFCVSQTNTNMGMASGALFIKHYFDLSSKTDTTKITEGLMQAFMKMLHEKYWLDHDTKTFAKTKINNMALKIGFPNFLLNETDLNMKYSDVKIEENFFFENVLSVLRHTSREDQNKVDLVVDKAAWNTPPAVVNAYYSRNKNQITGILQPPFYHKHFPKSLNFGGIGVVIGHEITHAFDDKGRLFDHEGNLQLWWKNDAIEKFYEKSQCIIEQYGRYTLPGLKTPLDGMITQGENIADNGGLKQSFRAYEKWVLENPNLDETLPALNMTGHQLFFLNFAQVWCGKQRIESARSRMKTAVHSPGMFRVIGALSNSEEFAKVYSCPKNSPMNPTKKCDLW